MSIFFRLIWNELRKDLKIAWGYRLQWITELLALLVFFAFLFHVGIRNDNSQLYMEFSITSYLFWFYSILTIGDMSGKISNEMRLGIFEAIYLSYIPIFFLMTIRLISTLIKSLLIVCVLGFFFAFLFDVSVSINTIFLSVVLFTSILPFLVGIGFLLGGAVMVFKELGSLVNILNNSLLFLSGVFLPLEGCPEWVFFVSRFIPTSSAIFLFKKIIVMREGVYTDTFFWQLGSITLLSSAYFIIGAFSFWMCEQYVRRKGEVSQH